MKCYICKIKLKKWRYCDRNDYDIVYRCFDCDESYCKKCYVTYMFNVERGVLAIEDERASWCRPICIKCKNIDIVKKRCI